MRSGLPVMGVCGMVYVHVAFAWRMVYVAWCMLLVYVVWVQNRSIPGTGSVFGNEIPVITNIIQYLTLLLQQKQINICY